MIPAAGSALKGEFEGRRTGFSPKTAASKELLAHLGVKPGQRLDVEAISLAYGVFEQPASTEAWLKAPHPLLRHASPLQHCRTAIGAGQVRRLLQALEQGAPV